MTDMLMAQFLSCFEQQNILMQECLMKQNQLILEQICTTISERFANVNNDVNNDEDGGNEENVGEGATPIELENDMTEYLVSGTIEIYI